jgi:hypothetical protein
VYFISSRGTLILGGVLLARTTGGYLASPLAASSTSGVRVFRLANGSLGVEPLVIGAGLVLVVCALTIAAVQGSAVQGAAVRSSSATRASTAASNAEAHTR